MNILIINSSPRVQGNSKKLSKEFIEIAEHRGHNCINLSVAFDNIRPCSHCGYCAEKDKCCLSDIMTKSYSEIVRNADCIIFASPVYFFGINAQAKNFLDRLYAIDLEDKLIGAILVSGSAFFEGGVDLTAKTFIKTCDFVGADFVGLVHKRTNDKLLNLTSQDRANLNKLLDNIEGNFDSVNSSVFIEG